MKKYFKIIVFFVLTILFSFAHIVSNNLLISFIGIVNSALISYMLIMIFSSIGQNNKSIMTKRLMLINFFWGVTFLAINILKYGTIFKILNLLAVFVIGSSLYEFIKIKVKKLDQKDENDAFKFAYVWLLFILLIPILIILVLIGY